MIAVVVDVQIGISYGTVFRVSEGPIEVRVEPSVVSFERLRP